MRQYDDLNQGLKSLNQKFVLPEHEQSEILSEINKKMNRPVKSRTPIQWKYYLSSAVAILLLVAIVLPFLNNDYQYFVGNNETEGPHGTSGDTPTTNDGKEEEITINIENQTSFDIYQMYIKIFQDGIMKQSQGGMIADGSAIEPGDVFDFKFYENELENGTYEIELDMSLKPSIDGNQVNEYSSQRVLLEITGQQNYTLELKGNSLNNSYLVNPTIEVYNQRVEKVETVKEKIKLGLTKQEVETLFGRDYKTVQSPVDNRVLRRYDFGAIGGYVFNGNDYADIAGMQAGTIQAQLIIEWDANNKVYRYIYFYLNSHERKIYSYEMSTNGNGTERMVCTYQEGHNWICPG